MIVSKSEAATRKMIEMATVSGPATYDQAGNASPQGTPHHAQPAQGRDLPGVGLLESQRKSIETVQLVKSTRALEATGCFWRRV